MKKHDKFLILLLLLIFGACRTEKFSVREQKSGREVQVSTLSGKGQSRGYFFRSGTFADSNSHRYQVTIFPVDTFQFSIEKGFSGRAKQVDVKGLMRQTKRLADSVFYIHSANSGIRAQTVRAADSSGNFISKLKQTDGSFWKQWTWVVMILFLLIVVIRSFRLLRQTGM